MTIEIPIENLVTKLTGYPSSNQNSSLIRPYETIAKMAVSITARFDIIR